MIRESWKPGNVYCFGKRVGQDGISLSLFPEGKYSPADFMWHIRTTLYICQLSRHPMVKATGEDSNKISWLQAKQMPIIVCFKSAGRHGQKPAAWRIDRGCWKGTEQRLKPVKFQRQDWYITIDGEGSWDVSKMTYYLCQMNYCFIYRSKSLCMLGTAEYEEDLF